VVIHPSRVTATMAYGPRGPSRRPNCNGVSDMMPDDSMTSKFTLEKYQHLVQGIVTWNPSSSARFAVLMGLAPRPGSPYNFIAEDGSRHAVGMVEVQGKTRASRGDFGVRVFPSPTCNGCHCNRCKRRVVTTPTRARDPSLRFSFPF
jgi:hypothetical protein